jgi:hypothetical protein
MTEYPLALTYYARPFFGHYTPVIVTLVQSLAFIAYVLLFRFMVASTMELEALIGKAATESLYLADIPIKAAADMMGVDESHLRKQLKHDEGRELSVYRLSRLPIKFWFMFLPKLSALLIERNLTQIAEDLSFRKSA